MVYLQVWKTPHALFRTPRGYYVYDWIGVCLLFLNPSGRLIANRPEFFIALTTMVIGTQFFVAGFLGEIVLQSRQNKERYLVSETTEA
jgi:hypothetical protein